MSFLAWKSCAVCDGLIAFNGGESCAKTARLCPNRKIVDSNKMFGWENCMLTILSLLIHSCLSKAKLLLCKYVYAKHAGV